MGIEQRTSTTESRARSSAGYTITETLLDFRSKGPVLFLISGGSALRVLDFIDPYSYDPQVTVVMGDERATSDQRYNNFLRLKTTEPYKRMKIAGSSVIETVPDVTETLQKFAQRYDGKIAAWFDQNVREHRKGYVLALLGIGEDGHTAGIMTGVSKNVRHRLTEPEHYIVGYQTDHGGAYPRRATISMWVLRNRVDAAIIYAWGETKSEAIQKVLAPKGSLWETPARIFREVEYPVVLFTSAPRST